MLTRFFLALLLVILAPAVPAIAQDVDQIMRDLRTLQQPSRQQGPSSHGARPVVREIPSVSARVTEVTKNAEARRILVIGDQQSEGLAQGLREIFAGEAMALIVGRSLPGVSLARGPATELIEAMRASSAEFRPAAVVVFAGVRDFVPIVENGVPHDLRSDRWKELYSQRVEAILKVAQDARVPVYWVAQVAQRARGDTQDVAHMNDIARAQVFAQSARYVDAWEGFVDLNGAFVPVGPDVNGMTRRLRTADGVGLTSAGYRKLAFFVATELRRDLTFEAPALALPTPDEPAVPGIVTPIVPGIEAPAQPARPFVGPVISLTTPVVVRGGELLGGPRRAGDERTDDLVGRVLLRGELPPARAGRGDDFSWPPSSRALPPGLGGNPGSGS